MTRSEEELRVGTRERESGRLRLRTWVESEPVQTTVQTRRTWMTVRPGSRWA